MHSTSETSRYDLLYLISNRHDKVHNYSHYCACNMKTCFQTIIEHLFNRFYVFSKLTNPECTFSSLEEPATRKAIHEQLRGRSGIYGFICTVNGKQYIGSAKNLAHRAGEHMSGVKSNVPLQRAIAKYGIHNFVFVVYEFAPYVLPDILQLEDMYLQSVHPDKLYNNRLSATSMLGYKHTPEAIKKMVDRFSDSTKHPFFGKTHTEASRKLISKPGELNPMYGKTHSDETRSLLSKQKSRPVYLFDVNNNFVKDFVSAKSASEHYNVHKTTIGRYCNKPKLFLGLYFIRSSR